MRYTCGLGLSSQTAQTHTPTPRLTGEPTNQARCLEVKMRQAEAILSPAVSISSGGGGGGVLCPLLSVDIHGAAGSDIDLYVG